MFVILLLVRDVQGGTTGPHCCDQTPFSTAVVAHVCRSRQPDGIRARPLATLRRSHRAIVKELHLIVCMPSHRVLLAADASCNDTDDYAADLTHSVFAAGCSANQLQKDDESLKLHQSVPVSVGIYQAQQVGAELLPNLPWTGAQGTQQARHDCPGLVWGTESQEVRP